MSRTYEMMYLLDNDAVRAGWNEAKAGVATLLEKHGGKVLAARRFDERKLAYTIKRRRRGTFLLVHAEMPPEGVTPLRRELDLADHVLRYLILSVDQVPAEELELTKAEAEADFVVPPPPAEDAEDVPEQASGDDASSSSEGSGEGDKAKDAAKPEDGDKAKDAEKTKDVEAKKAEAKKAEGEKVEQAEQAEKPAEEEKKKTDEETAVAEGAAKEEN